MYIKIAVDKLINVSFADKYKKTRFEYDSSFIFQIVASFYFIDIMSNI